MPCPRAAVTSTAVSGVYIARLQTNDGQFKSQIVFVVRDDSSHADLVLQTSDKFGEIMVVPAGKVNVSVDEEDIEVGLEVEAGTLQELE